MIDRMSGRVALLLVGGATVLIVLLGWFVLVSPQRAKATKLDTQVNQTNGELQAVTSLLNGPVGAQSRAALRVAAVAVPDDTKMSQILRQLSAASATAGVELDSVAPTAFVPLDGAQAIPMTISVKGHYFAIQHFLRILRGEAVLSGSTVNAHGRLYTVDTLQFSGQGSAVSGTGQATGASTTDTTPNLIVASLTVNAYVNAPGTVSAATTAATTGTTTTGTETTPAPTTTTP